MRTAVDTAVLLDVLLPDPVHGPASRAALGEAYNRGSLVACEVVFAELRAHFDAIDVFKTTVDLLGITFDPLDGESAMLAGELWRQHCKAGGKHRRVVADFLIGAHAVRQCDELLTRDRGFFRKYFSRLRLTQPD